MIKNLSIGFVFMAVLVSCQQHFVFNEYQNVANGKWYQEDIVAFEIPITDTIHKNNIYINLRNNEQYAYSNLMLITRMSFPNRVQVTDTLAYEMTDSKGNFLGSGFTKLKENKLFYKEGIIFPIKGNYLFEVKQVMRKRNEIQGIDPLEGVLDVGISIEKVKK